MLSLKILLGEHQCTVYAGPEYPHKTIHWDVKRHCNAQYELHIALKGNCTINVEEENFSLDAGEALLIAPGQYHCPKETSNDYECFIFSFVIKTESIAKDFYKSNARPSKICLSEFELTLCNELLKNSFTDNRFHRQCISSMYSLLISYTFKHLGLIIDYPKATVTNSDRRLDYIDDFFEQNLAENSTEEALAKRLNLSTRQLNRVLHTYYGMSFRQKLCNARMNSAGWLLCTTNMTVSEICRTVGYSSETSFFKTFRSYYNMTPLQYRKK